MFTERQTPAREVIVEAVSSKVVAFPNTTECLLDGARRTRRGWKDTGRFTVFNAGTFDVLGLNHIRGLAQCRLLGAMSLIGIEKIETPEELAEAHAVAASDRVRLMVTVDTDRALEMNKSRRPDKGGAPKPSLSWETRVAMLAIQTMPGPDGAHVDMVNYITRHGSDCCAVCAAGTCTHEDNARMAVALAPDLVVVPTGSKHTIADLSMYKQEGLLPYTDLASIDESNDAFEDPVLGGIISTTALVNRIRS